MAAKVRQIRERPEFANPFRPNYEKRISMVWATAGLSAAGTTSLHLVPDLPLWLLCVLSTGMALNRLSAALKLHNLQKHLSGRPLTFIDTPALYEQTQQAHQHVWLGHGFVWEQVHCQRLAWILERNLSDIVEFDDELMGYPFIHGLEPTESTILHNLNHAGLHTLVIGATGSGKTRLADLLISQAIWRDEPVIIIDPKGDKDLQSNAQAACEFMGRPEKYVSFHPAFPERCHRMNPLQNYVRLTELGGRVVAKMPGEGDGQAFKAYSQGVINSICMGLNLIGQRPTISLIKSYIDGRIQELTAKAIEVTATRVLGPARVNEVLGTSRSIRIDVKIKELTRLYWDEIAKAEINNDLEGLISLCQHDRVHFGKMIATLNPILSMLTSGDLGPLLSPDFDDLLDQRPITSSKQIIENNQVAYVGLDSLSDLMVGQTIGSMTLADLVSVAGERYNYVNDPKPVNLFIDESAEIANDQLIQILNKSRGAGFRVTIFTQSIADFEAAMGSAAKMNQVLDNVNNTLCFRVTGNNTQKYIAENLPQVTIDRIQSNLGNNSSATLADFGGTVSDRKAQEVGPIFPPQMLGSLPNLEFIAKLSGGRLYKGRIPILQRTTDKDQASRRVRRKYRLSKEDVAQSTRPSARDFLVELFKRNFRNG